MNPEITKQLRKEREEKFKKSSTVLEELSEYDFNFLSYEENFEDKHTTLLHRVHNGCTFTLVDCEYIRKSDGNKVEWLSDSGIRVKYGKTIKYLDDRYKILTREEKLKRILNG